MPKNDDTGKERAEFLNRIPEDIRESFTDEQVAAVTRAFAQGEHGVDIRFSVPMPGGRSYVVILAGREKRSEERRRLERTRHPLWTALNIVTIGAFSIMFFFFVVGLLYMVAS